jgi:hypothetical protein
VVTHTKEEITPWCTAECRSWCRGWLLPTNVLSATPTYTAPAIKPCPIAHLRSSHLFPCKSTHTGSVHRSQLPAISWD